MNSRLDITVKGNLVLPDRVVSDGTIGIRDGKIVSLHAPGEELRGAEHIDASGKLVFPGLVDPHVHSLSNPGEGIGPATASAAMGGVTTIVEMPYDKAAAINSPERFTAKLGKVQQETHVDIALLATLPKQAKKEDVAPLAELGACGVKLSVFETDPERFPRIDDHVLWEILPELGRLGVVTSFHAENDVIIEHLIQKAQDAGLTQARNHCLTRPPATETLAVGKLLELAFWLDFPLHIHHVSHPHCFEMARWYRSKGLKNLTMETCPHYLALCEDDMDRVGSLAKINPPIRPKADMETLWEYVRSGDVDVIGSDHAPWSLEQKNGGSKEDIFKSASGAPGLESLFPVMFTEGVVKRDIPISRLAALMAENPARRFGIGDRKGRIEPGLDADFVIIDPNQEWAFDPSGSASLAKWSPFAGKMVKGKIIRTVLRGKTVFQDGKLLAKPGDGKFLPVSHAGRAK